jgi:hypothetical protein
MVPSRAPSLFPRDHFFHEILSFPELSFGLQPEFDISSDWSVMFFPDFPGPPSDSSFAGCCHGAGTPLQFFCQLRYALDCFPIAQPIG